VGLERDPDSRALLDSAFRALHTTKGTGAYFGFHGLESVAHLGESVLAALRDGQAAFVPATATALLRLADMARTSLLGIERDGVEPDLDTAGLEADLRECLTVGPPHAAPRQRFGETLVAAGAVTPGDVAWAVTRQTAGDPRPIGAILLEAGLVDETQIESVLTLQGRGGQDSSVRVELDVLDRLVQLVGELARTRDVLAPGLEPSQAARLDEVTRSLQNTVLRTRVEPVERAWSSLPRLVRDLSETTGKRVRLVTEGQATPVDRALLTAVKAPLTHLLRNAVDHGVERPQDRRASGKPVEATLTVRARAEQDEVVLEVEDDGGGIDVAAVARTAVAQGVVSAAQVAAMGTEEVLALVLRSGLSTATSVTTVSGRGYGLDVVHTEVARVGGRVEIVNRPGLGCLVRLRLPHAHGGDA
jgi:two-component system chemotaxis sensor kinase CheA